MKGNPVLDEERESGKLRDRKMKSVTRAVANLLRKLNLPPDVVAEGAIRGAAVTMIASGMDLAEVVGLMRMFAEEVEEIDIDPPARRGAARRG